MKILLAAAEVAPYSTVGGLSQVISFLAKALVKQGHDVRIFSAKYGIIDPKPSFKEVVHHLSVPTGYTGKKYPKEIICNVIQDTKSSPITYFLENREYYELRQNVYGYKDDHIRFALLSRGCLEWIKHQKRCKGWVPDLIHVHDWHTGYLCEDARKNPSYKKIFKKIPLLLTVHNFHLQGTIDFKYLSKKEYDLGEKNSFHLFHKDFIKQNPLLRGILYADRVNTVSQNHAQEVLTEEYGEGLHEILIKNKDKLSGILNGIDIQAFNPKTDKLIKQNYTRKDLKLRKINKEDLQKEFELPINPDVPVIAFVGRLSKQKGIKLILKILPHLLDTHDFQFIVLGTGEEGFRKTFKKLSKEHPSKIKIHFHPDFKLPRKIFAGADMILMPSLFEPGGIVALEALRYGAIPIARETGGLADIITNFSAETKKGNGLSFKKANEWSFFATVVRALELYQFKDIWKKLVNNAMASDFSWDAVAKEYVKLYEKVAQQRKEFIKKKPDKK